jgi:hypothetical protein
VGEQHSQGERNISRYRYGRRRCVDVESTHADAMEYAFPDSKLILYFYNPFSPEVMQKVFMNLGKSLAERPRDVVVIMVNLETASVADSMPFLRLYYGTPKYRIYQTVNSHLGRLPA